MTALIEAEGLAKSFGTLKAVDGITLKVPRGEVLGFLGPNGAGKSTTMRLITGFLEPDAGRARIAGFDVQDQAREAKKRLGYLPEGAPLYAEMTPKGLLVSSPSSGGCGAALAKVGRHSRSRRPVLAPCSSRRSRRCPRATSAGSASPRRSCNDPEVLIMDEPTDGLDPNQKHQVRQLIAEMAKEKAIIVSTHILEEVEAVCTRAVVINRGRIVADGTAEDLMRRVPYHGAVAVRVAPTRPTPSRARSPHSRAWRSRDRRGGRMAICLLRAIPKNGAGIVTDVAVRHPPEVAGRRRDLRRARQARRCLPPDHLLRLGQAQCVRRCSKIWIVAKREFAAYFATPIAIVFLIIFVALTGAFAFHFGAFFERGQADLSTFFIYHPWLYLLLVPAIGMRLWAEERKTGTIELLMTLPVSPWEAILGKFAAAWAFLGLALVLTFPMWLTVNLLGRPDNGVILASYLGSFLMAGAYLAVASAISALTKNQVIAFIVAATVCFLFVMSGHEPVQNAFRAGRPSR